MTAKEIAKTIIDHLESKNLYYTYIEEHDIISLSYSCSGGISSMDFIFQIGDNEYKLFGKIPIDADVSNSNTVKRMDELACRINYGVRRNSFHFDSEDGEIRTRYSVRCINSQLSERTIKNSIFTTYHMIITYSKGILETLYSDKSVEEIVKECKRTDPLLSEPLDKPVAAEDALEIIDNILKDLESDNDTDSSYDS